VTIDHRRRWSGLALAPRVSAPAFDLLESKLRPPRRRGRTVPRAQLIDRLERAHATPTVVVSAGAGWGKTTLLAQWAARSRRPFAWISVDERDNDPIVLLSYVAVALDRIARLDASVFEALASPGVSVEATIVPRLSAALTRVEHESVLALDDLHRIDDARCFDAIAALATHLPDGLQLAVATRGRSGVPVEVMRAEGLTLEIGADELRLGPSEARQLLRAAGVKSTAERISELVGRTEGWPAGLHLAAQTLKARGAPVDGTLALSGDDPLVADYLRTEVLAHLSRQELRFLTSTSILDRLSGPLCDAVLEQHGSAAMLEALADANVFVVPLDATRESYRYQRLPRELLRSALNRLAPERGFELRARAIDWCEANGEPEDAIAYAQAAGDVDRVARLVGRYALHFYCSGRVAAVERWFDWLEARGALEYHATLAVLDALLATSRGRSATANRLAELADHTGEDGELPDGSASIESWRMLLRAQRCPQGVAAMRADAEFAVRTLARTSSHRPIALMLLGIATLLQGDVDEADDLLSDVVEEGIELHTPHTAAVALAERAAIAIEREAWAGAEELVDRSIALVQRTHTDAYPTSAFVYAIAARIVQHRGDARGAGELLARAQSLRLRLTHALPYLAVQTRLELARAHLARADSGEAGTVCREIDALLCRQPELGVLRGQADELRTSLETIRAEAPASSTLTTAELRVLPYLETHLSFREIGQRLYVSPHTVKSHAMTIYRKLSVTSRGEAVERAHELGLR
jgi:LuxR family transcriptional regulator, maltose regulon positive regulatory protein